MPNVPEKTQNTTVVNTSIPQSAVIAGGNWQWVASPSSAGNDYVCKMYPGSVNYSSYYVGNEGFCPIVSLNH